MKKKIIFLLCVAFMLVTFAIVGSATTYYTDGTTEYFECEIADTYHIDSYIIKNGGFPKFDSDGDALTWYLVSSETDTETGNITKTVASVKTKEVYNDSTSTYTGIDKTLIVSANYDAGTTTVPVFGAFSGSYSKETLFIYIPDSVTTLPARFCQNVPVIICEFTENSMCSSWGDLTFWGARSLRELFIPKHFTKFPSSKDGEFTGCTRFEKITFHKESTLSVWPGWYFGSTKIKEIILPDSITYLNSRAFQGMEYLEYVKLSKNLEYIYKTDKNHSLFHSCSSLKTVVIPKTLVAENLIDNYGGGFDYSFSTGNPTFVYTGTLEEFEKIKEVILKAGNNSALSSATAENGRIVIANHCEVYYDGNHDTDDGKCETAMETPCTRCQRQLEAKEHKITVDTLKYPNGFASAGVRNYLCENEGCYFYDRANEPTSAIFSVNEYNGFSTDGKGGISFGGFLVNTQVLDEFNKLNADSKITFGAVIMNPKYLTGETFFDGDNVNAEGGYIKVDLSETRYSNIKIDIDGISGEAIDISLIMAIYAYTGEEDLTFIQSETTKCADRKVTRKINGKDTSLYTVTLASVTNQPNAYIPNLKEYGEE